VKEESWWRQALVLRWVILGVLVLTVVWVAFSAFFFFMRPLSSFYFPFYRPFFFPFGLLFGLFVIFIVFGALRWVFAPWRWGYRRRHWRYRDQSYYILRERYAKGEITKEQFEQMMQELEKTR
jgi:putative membrane protein